MQHDSRDFAIRKLAFLQDRMRTVLYTGLENAYSSLNTSLVLVHASFVLATQQSIGKMTVSKAEDVKSLFEMTIVAFEQAQKEIELVLLNTDLTEEQKIAQISRVDVEWPI